MTTIEWTQETWNPILGCSKISEGCRNCYAINQAYRNWNMAQALPEDKRGRLAYYEGLTEKRGSWPSFERIEWTGRVVFVPEALEIPLKRKKPTTYFVNSMSDLFHESVKDEWIDQIFAVMALTPQHTYQVLTKRPERMLEYFSDFHGRTAKWADASVCIDGLAPKWLDNEIKSAYPVHSFFDGLYLMVDSATDSGSNPLPNVYLGVTVENQQAADDRIPLLLKTPAAVRFLSCEPLLEEIDLSDAMHWKSADNCNLDWVIVGGESGAQARFMQIEWARSLVRQCKEAQVPVFMKQLGANVYESGKTERVDAKHVKILEPYVQFKTSDRKGKNMDEWPEDLRVRQFPVQL